MKTPFEYRARSVEDWNRRANQSGSDYETYIKGDEYRTFSPAKGENCIRLLPPSPAWTDANHYGLDVFVHYGIGPERASVICLFKMKQQPCFICEERARADRAKDEDLAKDLKATRRVLVFLINRKDEGQGALVWGMPYTVDRDISKASKDRSTGEYYFVDHPEHGYDIYVDKDGEGLATKYSGVGLARRPSHIPDKILEWLQDNPLPDVLRWRTYEEVKRLYEGVGRGEKDEDATNVVSLDRGRLGRPGADRRNGERAPEPDDRDRDRGRGGEDDRRPPPRRDPEPPPEPVHAAVRRAILERPGARLSRPGSEPPADDPARPEPRQRLGEALDDEVPPFDTTPPPRPAPSPPPGAETSRASALRARFLDR